MNLNLLLAGVWMIIGAAILLGARGGEEGLFGLSGERSVVVGAFALVLAGYNLVRWRLSRLARRAEDAARAAREPLRRRRPDEPPNPDFDFSDGGPDEGPRPS